MTETMTLDQLMERLKPFGQDNEIVQKEYWDGSSEAVCIVRGKLCASWRGRLVSIPPLDGVTPRGPKEYYDFKTYGLEHSKRPNCSAERWQADRQLDLPLG